MIIDPISLGMSGQLAPAVGGKFCPAPLTLGSSGQIVLAVAVALGRIQQAGAWNIEDDDNDILDLITIVVASGVLNADS